MAAWARQLKLLSRRRSDVAVAQVSRHQRSASALLQHIVTARTHCRGARRMFWHMTRAMPAVPPAALVILHSPPRPDGMGGAGALVVWA